VEFNVEAAKAYGLSDEEIQKLIAAGPPSIRNEEITTEETVVTPTPVQAPLKTKPTFNEEITTEETIVTPTPVQAPLKTKPTFNVEAAKAYGLSDEEIQKLIAAGPPKQPTFNVEAAKAYGLSDEDNSKAYSCRPS
jgi:FKBP-type peptidyl-prolyl cis-trans isomerase 2